MSSFEGLYNIRDAKEGDTNFVLATFLRGLYYGDSWFSLIPKSVFMDNYKPVAEALLRKHTVKVACLKEDSDVIIGYSITSKDNRTLHWVHVKRAWREKGIGRSLVPKDVTEVTHLTKRGQALLSKLSKETIFNPFNI